MRTFLLPLIIPALLLVFSLSAVTAAAAETGVTVLIYHRFGEEKYPTTNVAVDRFREQMTFLRENGYKVISLESLVHDLQGSRKIPEKAVVITIDDGYRSVYENAWPVLRDFHYPFTVFLYAKATENRHSNYMTWEQVREMKNAGVDFQNHGFAHEHMAFIPPGMDMHDYRAWIRADLAASIKILSEELDERPRFFAVPYGEYNEIVLDEIRSFGYEAIILQDPGSVSSDTDPLAIPREPILGNEWSTMEHFREVLERVDLPIRREVPSAGQLPENTPKRFGAHLLYPESYVPGTIGIYVTELGWQQATVEDDFASITNSNTLKRRINRVAVSAREKETGKTAIRFWMLVGQ
ncbi:MAG: polysaccharide deacetylase [Desulfobacterales bacterium SG8_35]|nr:MAG: polysaccharide deacetylase [Desulfobacterales bacterium SG8_35]